MLQDVACASWGPGSAGVSAARAAGDVHAAVKRYQVAEHARCHDGCRTLPCVRARLPAPGRIYGTQIVCKFVCGEVQNPSQEPEQLLEI